MTHLEAMQLSEEQLLQLEKAARFSGLHMHKLQMYSFFHLFLICHRKTDIKQITQNDSQ